MEIADVFVINKADRPGADRLRTEVQLMLKLRARAAAPARENAGVAMPSGRAHALDAAAHRQTTDGDDGAGHWLPPVLTAVATEGKGIPELVSALDRHYEYLSTTGLLTERRRARLRERVKDVVDQKVRSRLWSDAGTSSWVGEQLPALESGQTTPYDVADALLRRSAALLTGRPNDLDP